MSLVPEYEGEYSNGKFHGKGTYDLDGIGKYVGDFANGVFHGKGIFFVKGGRWDGEWEHGILAKGDFIFDDGLKHKRRNWEYCSRKDPRFFREIVEGVPISGPLRYKTSYVFDNPPDMPEGCYDVIEGYYNPVNKAIFSYLDNEVIRLPPPEEIQWILDNCRQKAGF